MIPVTRVPVKRLRLGLFSTTDIDPSPGVPHANGAAYRRLSAQVKTPLEALTERTADARIRNFSSVTHITDNPRVGYIKSQ
jgi:hypothetical protein